jgi:hypothetical protein
MSKISIKSGTLAGWKGYQGYKKVWKVNYNTLILLLVVMEERLCSSSLNSISL